MEHRPAMTPRHRTLFWTALAIPVTLVPCCFSSALVSRLQLLRGLLGYLFPCGFQVRAWRVVLDAGFLRVCPIQPHLFCICLATGSCPAHWPQEYRLLSHSCDSTSHSGEQLLDLLRSKQTPYRQWRVNPIWTHLSQIFLLIIAVLMPKCLRDCLTCGRLGV